MSAVILLMVGWVALKAANELWLVCETVARWRRHRLPLCSPDE